MESDGVCANIGPRQRRRRLLMAIACFGAAAIGTMTLAALRVDPRWRLVLLFVPVWVGSLSLLQVTARTCVVLAARGLQNMDRGEQPVTDAAELRQMRNQAHAVHLRALLLAGLIAGIIIRLVR